tara:strand:- start:1189 stop:1338 length:150 start_codon:yes stop_codon:yes gene_type:complete
LQNLIVVEASPLLIGGSKAVPEFFWELRVLRETQHLCLFDQSLHRRIGR